MTMATNVADLRDRLAIIHASAERAKRRAREGAFEYITALGECLVPVAVQFVLRTAHGASELAPLPANLVFSNIRGPQIPRYMAGARVEELYPMSMLQVGNGLNVTAVTHDDQVDFGFLVDPNLVPDPWMFADAVLGALVELEETTAEVACREIAAGVPTTMTPTAGESENEFGVELSEAPRETGSGPEIVPESDPLDLSLIMASLDTTRDRRDERSTDPDVEP